MKHTDHPTLQSQEPDRLLHPEEYGSEERRPLLAGGEGNNSDHCPQDTETETYPPCGNSHQPSYRLCIALCHNLILHVHLCNVNEVVTLPINP